MNRLVVEQTLQSPKIDFDPDTGILELKGKSIPDRTVDFYSPVMNWIVEYVKNPASTTTCNFVLEYYNSRTKKYLIEMMKAVNKLTDQGKELIVNWYYEEGDEDVQETGQMFKDLLRMDINIIEIPDGEEFKN
ncbi:MAG: DUF1987 domain-containing protein [Bacteroidia bacterium]|nr:DUF1987 domain-containing protein [Bacteroidia bacterium]